MPYSQLSKNIAEQGYEYNIVSRILETDSIDKSLPQANNLPSYVQDSFEKCIDIMENQVDQRASLTLANEDFFHPALSNGPQRNSKQLHRQSHSKHMGSKFTSADLTCPENECMDEFSKIEEITSSPTLEKQQFKQHTHREGSQTYDNSGFGSSNDEITQFNHLQYPSAHPS